MPTPTGQALKEALEMRDKMESLTYPSIHEAPLPRFNKERAEALRKKGLDIWGNPLVKAVHEPLPELGPITDEERLNMTDDQINEENERDYKAW